MMNNKILKFLGLGSAAILTDFFTSNLLFYSLNWSVTLCGMLGFLAGTIVAYFIHLRVTFVARNLDFSWQALYRFLKSSLLAAIIRVLSLSLLEWFTNFYGFIVLLLSIGISSLTRYLLANFYVFKKLPQPPE